MNRTELAVQEHILSNVQQFSENLAAHQCRMAAAVKASPSYLAGTAPPATLIYSCNFSCTHFLAAGGGGVSRRGPDWLTRERRHTDKVPGPTRQPVSPPRVSRADGHSFMRVQLTASCDYSCSQQPGGFWFPPSAAGVSYPPGTGSQVHLSLTPPPLPSPAAESAAAVSAGWSRCAPWFVQGR